MIQLVLVVIQVSQATGLEKKTILKLRARYISAVILDISSMAQKKEHVWQMEAGQEDNPSAKVNQKPTQFLNVFLILLIRKPILHCQLCLVTLDWQNFSNKLLHYSSGLASGDKFETTSWYPWSCMFTGFEEKINKPLEFNFLKNIVSLKNLTFNHNYYTPEFQTKELSFKNMSVSRFL